MQTPAPTNPESARWPWLLAAQSAAGRGPADSLHSGHPGLRAREPALVAGPGTAGALDGRAVGVDAIPAAIAGLGGTPRHPGDARQDGGAAGLPVAATEPRPADRRRGGRHVSAGSGIVVAYHVLDQMAATAAGAAGHLEQPFRGAAVPGRGRSRSAERRVGE